MTDTLRLLCVVAHPDDETFVFGGALARYAAEGVETHVICATCGQFGWPGEPAEYPGPEVLGQQRVAELQMATQILGVHETEVLDYLDGHLAPGNLMRLRVDIAMRIRRIRPQVVLTFGPDGDYGHPDHVAVSQVTTAAVVTAAAGSELLGMAESRPPHRIDKLYYVALTHEQARLSSELFGNPVVHVNGVPRHFRFVGYDEWYHTARIETWPVFEKRWNAGLAHRSQVSGLPFDSLRPEAKLILWGEERYYRAMSFVPSDGAVESDLFAGVRPVAEKRA